MEAISPYLRWQSSLQRTKCEPRLHWAISDAKTAEAFGDVVAVPTLFLFDRSGKTSRVLYGAPPDLHAQAEKELDKLVKGTR